MLLPIKIKYENKKKGISTLFITINTTKIGK